MILLDIQKAWAKKGNMFVILDGKPEITKPPGREC
jgi:hypothetical protein